MQVEIVLPLNDCLNCLLGSIPRCNKNLFTSSCFRRGRLRELTSFQLANCSCFGCCNERFVQHFWDIVISHVISVVSTLRCSCSTAVVLQSEQATTH